MAKTKQSKKSKNIRSIRTTKKTQPATINVSKIAPVKDKQIAVKLAGALYLILGLVTIFSGFILIYLSYSSIGPILALGEVLMQGNLAIFLIGITSVTLGAVEFLVGLGIWRMYKWASTIGIVMAAVSIFLSIPYTMLNPFSGIMSLAISIILVVLLYTSRKEFQGADFQ